MNIVAPQLGIPEASGRAWHVVERLSERYGIAIRVEQVAKLEAAARAGLVLRRHGTAEFPEWRGRAIVCVLVGEARELVTVLPARDHGLKSKIRAGIVSVDRQRSKAAKADRRRTERCRKRKRRYSSEEQL